MGFTAAEPPRTKAPVNELRPPNCNLLCIKVDVSAIGVSDTAFIYVKNFSNSFD